METTSGARARATYRPRDRQVTVKISTGKNALWDMFTLADFIEIFNQLKTTFNWLTEEKLYHQTPPPNVEQFGLGPCLIFFVPDNQEEPTDLPRD